MATFRKTYWAGNGRFQAMAEHLTMALPQYGAVKGNPSLERFRQLSNLYYDAFNNGGINKAKELAKLCKVDLMPETALESTHIDIDDMGKVFKKLEQEMDKLVPVAFVKLFENPNADDEKKIARLEKQNAKLQNQVDAMKAELNGRYQQIEKLQKETLVRARKIQENNKALERAQKE